MFRYVATTWNASDRAASDTAQAVERALHIDSTDWRVAFKADGISVYCAGIRPGCLESYRLDGEAGVIVGTLFTRSNNEAVTSPVGAPKTRKLIETDGRQLLDSYWGRYVAFLNDPARHRKYVLRSPTGELDCLMAELGDVRVFFSSMTHCPVSQLLKCSVNWAYVAADLCVTTYETRDTGLNEVSRVVHGERVELSDGGVSRMLLWHPLRIATSDPIYNVVEATDAIQKATSSCVAAWASRYESVLHLLSGGLDSSVVAMYLQRATVRPRVTYLNIRNSHDASSDERRYARVVAQSTGFPMEEHEQNVVFSLHNRLAVPRTESPFNNFYLLAPEDRTTQLATSLQARGLFTGEGGDQIFYQNGARFAWRDFARMRGPRPALLRSAFDAARIEGETIWSLFFREPLRAPLASLSSGLASQVLIDSNVRESVAKNRKFLHPWVDGSEPALPGKFWHALLLSGAVAEEMYGPLGSSISPERVSPLVSQPLVEICLRIPTFVLISGGHERALARRAFCSVVPREILTRPTKAALYDSAKALLAYNLELIRELLLDGILVRQGILDRKPLERFLSGTATDIRGHAPRVLTYVLCEVWLQSWSHTQRAAA